MRTITIVQTAHSLFASDNMGQQVQIFLNPNDSALLEVRSLLEGDEVWKVTHCLAHRVKDTLLETIGW